MPGPVPRVPAPNDRPDVRLVPSAAGRPAVRRAPSLDDRPAAGRAPSRAGGRAVRRAPSAEGGRARSPSSVGSGPPGSFGRGRPRGPAVSYPLRADATFAGSPQHRGPWSTLARGPGRCPGRPARSISGRCPGATPGAVARCAIAAGAAATGARFLPGASGGRPAPAVAADPLVPAGRGLLGVLGVFAAPAVARPVFGYRGRRRYDRRRLPLGSSAFRVLRPRSSTSSLQHYPDKRRGPLNHIGSDPLQACPAASYSPTRSPAQYHRR